ncbi:hypothetical protein AOLI_G00328840 [Acnodon oligacanthus]
MALSLTALENDLKCGICKGTYKEPVILLCSHNFCKVCLEKHWLQHGARKCPKCRKRSSLENPPINRALKKICKSFLKEKNRSTLPNLPESPGVLCSQHADTLSLFCVDDQKLVCGECVSQEHQMHNLCSIKKAVSDRKNFEEEEKRAQYTVPDPELDPGALIDVAKHLWNLKYKVWEKMKNICPYFPVILDPNSASKILTLSEDLSMVTHGLQQDLPNNPERFSVHPFVLGSEGFDSGTHSWEVEVGNSESWMIGVAKESVTRKETIQSSPENGIWMIRLRNSKYSFNDVNLPIRYQKIRVELDLSAGEVRFFNPDKDELLQSFNGMSTEKLHPLFLTYDSSSLKILPATVSVLPTISSAGRTTEGVP